MTRGFAAIDPHSPKDKFNVGSALRAAGCYEGAFVAYTGNRYRPATTDTMKQHRHIPLLRFKTIDQAIPYDYVPVAVDLVEGAVSLVDYQHPERAFCIFGPEDGTLSEKVLSKCRDRVMIPMKGCSNLAATVNVVLYDRLVKRGAA